MSAHDDLSFQADFSAPNVLLAYDEAPLWSAMFGLLLLEEVPLASMRAVLDVGCGTGFPLIELAERLGTAQVHGIDPWKGGLARAAEKVAARATPNVTLHEGSAARLPFADGTFDLIVSNLGINNFDDPPAVLRECRRVARSGATLAMTTNLQGHMQELYDLYAHVIAGHASHRLPALEAHIAHRATVPAVRHLLETGGFSVERVVERTTRMRFASGTALLNHHFIKLGFLDGWRTVAGEDASTLLPLLHEGLDAHATKRGELSLTIPMAYIEARADPPAFQ